MMNADRLVKHIFRIVVLAMLACAGNFPALAAEPGTPAPDPVRPVIVDLVQRILGDPAVNYDSVADPSDCKSVTLYLGTRDVLGKYVASPAENRTSLQDYILSGDDQCSCAEAIIGKNFDILLHDLGPETAKYRSCYDITYARKTGPR